MIRLGLGAGERLGFFVSLVSTRRDERGRPAKGTRLFLAIFDLADLEGKVK